MTSLIDFTRLDTPPPLLDHEALVEANRCLMCWEAPCTWACPTSIDVPGFIKKIASGDLVGSARTILEANILGASCARVCPTEVLCEGACVLNDLHHRPIEIGRLQGYATDPIVLGGTQLFTAGDSSGFRVAVVGAGPAGLACAAELARRGHHAVVLEASAVPGGLNSHGVADYKMKQATSLAEVEWIQGLGVEVRPNVTVGVDVEVDELLEHYDAIFLGIGLGPIPLLGIAGEDLAGYEDALDFIARLKARPHEEVSLAGQRVAVIGGGNTAIDSVTQSARLGADKVYLVYRRGRQQMRAYDHEIAKARSDGVEFVFWTAPSEIMGDGKVEALRCQRTELRNDEVVLVDDSEFTLDVTRVLRATGQAKRTDFVAAFPDVAVDGAGRVVVTDSFATANAKVWAGGDCANGGKEVVNAVAHGKQAAIDIDATLTGR
jgi:glutamate synthase (NADPH/NADH) small chain